MLPSSAFTIYEESCCDGYRQQSYEGGGQPSGEFGDKGGIRGRCGGIRRIIGRGSRGVVRFFLASLTSRAIRFGRERAVVLPDLAIDNTKEIFVELGDQLSVLPGVADAGGLIEEDFRAVWGVGDEGVLVRAAGRAPPCRAVASWEAIWRWLFGGPRYDSGETVVWKVGVVRGGKCVFSARKVVGGFVIYYGGDVIRRLRGTVTGSRERQGTGAPDGSGGTFVFVQEVLVE